LRLDAKPRANLSLDLGAFVGVESPVRSGEQGRANEMLRNFAHCPAFARFSASAFSAATVFFTSPSAAPFATMAIEDFGFT